MGFSIYIITICGLMSGVYTLLKINKTKGIFRLALAALCPIITMSFCSLKDDRVFGGTNWEFLVHSATIDGDIWPWVILILFIIEIIYILKTIYVVAIRR